MKDQSSNEWTVNLYLPADGWSEPLPFSFGPSYKMGELRDLVAEMSGVPRYQITVHRRCKNQQGYTEIGGVDEEPIQAHVKNGDALEMHISNRKQLCLKKQMKGCATPEDPPGSVMKKSPPRKSPRSVQYALEWSPFDQEVEQIPFHSQSSTANSSSTANIDSHNNNNNNSGVEIATDMFPTEAKAAVATETAHTTTTTMIDMEKFLDPIFFTLMADPVVCSDGNTYDRTTIEQHFQSRRQIAEAQRTGQEDAEDGATMCCGACQQAIELTSPLTGEVVTPMLIPNRHVEQSIVEYVEAGKFADLSSDDLADWKQRREQKRDHDRLRYEHEQRERAAADVRRQNAMRAQALRDAEETTSESATDLSIAFRIVREPANQPETNHLGLAVPLCDADAKIDGVYFRSLGPQPRCMITCCAQRLPENSNRVMIENCDRCGRVACHSCLQFRVANYHDHDHDHHHRNQPTARICTECVMQLVDHMPREGDVGRLRATILRTKLRTRLDEIQSQASNALDTTESNAAEQRFGPVIHQLESELQDLEQTQHNLQAEIHQAETTAQRARTDDGVGAPRDEEVERSADEWDRLRQELQDHFDTLLDEVTPDDEEAQTAHMLKISDCRHRLEKAELGLAEVMSRSTTLEVSLERPSSNDEPIAIETMDVPQLQRLLVDLETELQHMSNRPLDERSTLEHTMRRSTLSAKIDAVQTRLLTEATTTQRGAKTSAAVRGSQLEDLQSEYHALISQREFAVVPDEDLCRLVMRITELEAKIEEAQMAATLEGSIEVVQDSFDNWWDAVGCKQDEDWPLPFGLEYPSTAMSNHTELMKNQLSQTKLQRQTYHEARFNLQVDELISRKDALEDRVAQLRAQASSAQENAEAEEKRLAERRERNQREEEERRRREQERQERERRIREEEERLRAKHERDEAATREALQRVVGTEDNAAAFGGNGDLRMCGRCKTGPIENFACSNLTTHNNRSTTYKDANGNRVEVASKANPNHCPNCDWFDPHWHNWPKWDGIMGPH